MLYCAPLNAASVLMIGWFINPAVLQPFRLIYELSNTIGTQNTTIAMIQSDSMSRLSAIESLQTILSTQQSTMTSVQSSMLVQQSTILIQNSTIATLQIEAFAHQSTISARSTIIAALESSTAAQSATIATLENADLAQQSTISAQSSSIAVLQSDATSVCSRPLCGDGATPSDGVCIPDCT